MEVILADEVHGGFGAIHLTKFESKSGGDGDEVAIGPRSVTIFENIAFNAIGYSNRDEDLH